MTEVMNRCRFCGATSEHPEHVDLDPAPGVCPDCMKDRMASAMQGAAMQRGALTDTELIQWMQRQLIENVGLTPDWAARFLSGDRRPFLAAIAELRGRHG